jgi:P27 family predicted phage terminase small subunit
MGKRGPTPQSKIRVLDPSAQTRPNPPVGMTPRARNLFKKVVGENKTGTFDAEAVAMLRAFCEADVQHFLATKELQKQGAVIFVTTRDGNVPRRNPWFNIQKEAASTMTSVSTKLRNKGIKTEAEKPKSKREGLMFKG